MEENKIIGLSSEEVLERVEKGQVNKSANLKTKSIKRIFYDNIFTLFNAINIVLFIALILVGSYKNMLFIGVVVANIVIGIIQEIRSKISVDKLTILSEKKVDVVRNSKVMQISKENIVIDDVLILKRGSQIPADCIIIDGECRVNESLLTGESDLIEKKSGDTLLSGSFVSAGKCCAKAQKVGADCYAAKINNEAKYVKKVNSEILHSFNFIIKLCTFIMFPIGILFFIRQFGIQSGDIQGTVVSTVAALVGMIPKGMILLTSSVLAVSIIRLSHKKVLVQEMYCIETLARVDVLCLDKTGTLTADEMQIDNIISLNDSKESEINTALASVVKSSDEINATLGAIKEKTKDTKPLNCAKFVQFSSETKWSGGEFENSKTYIIGATEFVFSDKEKYKEVYQEIEKISSTVRILVLASSDEAIENNILPKDLKPMAIILIKDKLRDNVKQTIGYFKDQNVTLKVISGDSVKTVQNIAKDTGIDGADKAVDMTEIKSDEELKDVAESCNIFGRVTPIQKKKLVLALKEKGHTVAMTGDGVNDVLALKEADCSVSMASGSDAARNVSQLVLVNNDFASMPQVVYEGRKTINNLERSSSLYLVKTIFSLVLSIFFIFFSMSYPFEPIQLTLAGAFTVAIPSFVLALQPNKNRVKGNFTFNIIARAMPAAVCVIMNIISLAIVNHFVNFGKADFSTMSVYLTMLSCMLLVLRVSFPLNLLRTIMIAVCVSGTFAICICFREFFSLSYLVGNSLVIFVAFALATVLIFNILYNIAEHFIKKYKG